MSAGPGPHGDAGLPRSGSEPNARTAGFRVLCVSVRGHRYLVGAPTAHPVDPVPAHVGRRFASDDDIERYVRQELRGLSALWRVEVIDDDAVVIRRGTRSGPGGTGERWTWQQT